jgi:M6 family metalloprotease-like protein
MPQSAKSYGITRELSYDTHRKYIADAITAADATFDFSQTDIVYVVAPKTDFVSFSPTFRGAPGTFTADGRKLGPAVTFGLDAYTWGSTIVPHETGHALGLPDLYAFGGADIHRFVGSWDLMGDVFHATDLFAWERLKLGWIDRSQIVCASTGGTTTLLTPLARYGGVKAVFVRITSTKALLVENRQPLAHDSRICDKGALVYTVDSAVATGEGPIRVVGGTTAGCGSGERSDAPFHSGESLRIAGVRILVSEVPGKGLSVRVTRP